MERSASIEEIKLLKEFYKLLHGYKREIEYANLDLIGNMQDRLMYIEEGVSEVKNRLNYLRKSGLGSIEGSYTKYLLDLTLEKIDEWDKRKDWYAEGATKGNLTNLSKALYHILIPLGKLAFYYKSAVKEKEKPEVEGKKVAPIPKAIPLILFLVAFSSSVFFLQPTTTGQSVGIGSFSVGTVLGLLSVFIILYFFVRK